MSLQDEETPIDRAIVDEIVRLIPETWDRAILDVVYTCDENGEDYSHSLWNPDGRRDLVEPSDAIYEATFQLQQLFRKHGGTWKSVRYGVEVETDGVRYKVRFQHP